MKKVILVGVIFILSFTMFACRKSPENLSKDEGETIIQNIIALENDQKKKENSKFRYKEGGISYWEIFYDKNRECYYIKIKFSIHSDPSYYKKDVDGDSKYIVIYDYSKIDVIDKMKPILAEGL